MAPNLHSENIDVERLLKVLGIDVERQEDLELWCCCPFHGEKTPSWSIVDNPDGDGDGNGLHQCFGCGESGDAIDLVMQLKDCRYPAACDWLVKHRLDRKIAPATKVKLILNRPDPEPGTLVLPSSVRSGDVSSWATLPRRYLEGRRVSPAQAKRWGLGYASGGRLRGRIVFPIRDANGTLLTYNARTFAGDPKKYKQAHPSENPQAGGIFGEEHWNKSAKLVVITEGEFNALACETAGFDFVAALSGSSPSKLQLSKLARFDRMIIASDPDKAGRKVARVLEFNYARYRDVRTVEFPPGEDASSILVKRGAAPLRELLWAGVKNVPS